MQIRHISITGTSKKAAPAVLMGEVRLSLLSQAVRVYLSNLRQGTSKVKTRSEIARTKKKWFKQKGTGNARHGARTPNIFVGGGVSHGPNGLQNWTRQLSRTMKQKALQTALTLQTQKDAVVVHEELLSLKGKTKEASQLLTTVGTKLGKVLVILPESNQAVVRALRNIEDVLVMTAHRVTALEVSTADTIVTSTESLEVLTKRLGSETKSETKKAVLKKTPAKKTTPKK